ncbi:hypothetical protein PIB30_045292 [Stylosanthes scabra]|uniref:Uncharacterized protein n=1 Tax=Stylosanthes scabra TaxID=79078 RepID=A0ABU6UER5_9FABA|nr:hypothetical protein [Stylosanthes scabra]
MAMKNSVTHAQQIIMLLIIIIGVFICFVIAESHDEIVPNKESWTPSNYYIAHIHIKNITSANGLREFIKYCIEEYWHLRTLIKAPQIKECNQCIDEGFDNFAGIDHGDSKLFRLRSCVKKCIDIFWPRRLTSPNQTPPGIITCVHSCFHEFQKIQR